MAAYVEVAIAFLLVRGFFMAFSFAPGRRWLKGFERQPRRPHTLRLQGVCGWKVKAVTSAPPAGLAKGAP
jgi:hypothetical protein